MSKVRGTVNLPDTPVGAAYTDNGTFTTTFIVDISVPNDSYGVAWADSSEVPTKKAIYEKLESLSSGLSVGTPVTGAGTNRVLYVDTSENLATSSRLLFDASDLILQNPTPATSGVPAQSAPNLIFKGEGWTGSASRTYTLSLKTPMDTNGMLQKIAFEAFVPAVSTWDVFSIAANSLDTVISARHPHNPGWGGQVITTYDGNWAFKNLGGTLSGLQPGYISWTGQAATGYQSIRSTSTYGTIIQSAFGSPIWIKSQEAGFGANGPFYVELDTSFGGTHTPEAAIHVVKTTDQLRLGYDATNYATISVGSSGMVSLDTRGASAGFTFFDAVTMAEGKNLIFGTTTGTKLGTASTEKIGFWGNTPIVRFGAYDVNNFATRRTFDPTADSIEDFMNFVCTVYKDLADYGLFTEA